MKVPPSASRHLAGRIGGQTLQGERVIASVSEVLGKLQQLVGFRLAHPFDRGMRINRKRRSSSPIPQSGVVHMA
jgi:hypothetical protein